MIPFLTKYKPKYLKDLKLDDNIINLLLNLININNLSIILIGDHGSGKTTIVNTIIEEYYSNISKDDLNDNILYVNSIKDQGIQYYRSEVKTFCQTKCTIPNKIKTIVIDDIDNINEQSQLIFRNALDKYLYNINFIFTCRNLQKVTDSLPPRLMPINIKKPTEYQLKKIVDSIIMNENIKIDDKCIDRLIELSSSVQTLINYLEKLYLLNSDVTMNIIDKITTDIDIKEFNNLTNISIKENNVDLGVKKILEIYNKGYSVLDVLDDYFCYIKNCDILNEEEKYRVIKIICKYTTIVNTVHDNEIELCFFVNEITKINQKNHHVEF
jgi:DNA polymerase III delta prime subunit